MFDQELPLQILKSLKGVRYAFYLDNEIKSQMLVEESHVKAAGGKVKAENKGVEEAFTRDHVIAIIKDPRFRPPPEPTVILMSGDGKRLGEEVFPTNKKDYDDRKDIVWLSDAFVLFPNVVGKNGEKFVMPPVSFPELNPSNGCKDVVSCSPAPTCDQIMRKHFDYPDDGRLASVLVAFNEC